MDDITDLLKSLGKDDPQTADRLLAVVYAELRRLAAQKLAHEAPGHTLQPTALVHEVYLRLLGPGNETAWDDRAHFFGAAAEAMRRILIENFRRKHRQKRGGHRHRLELDEAEILAPERSDDLLALDEALNLLTAEDAQKGQLVKLRFFAGLTLDEAARCLGISRATANRHWVYARAWLYEQLKSGEAEAQP